MPAISKYDGLKSRDIKYESTFRAVFVSHCESFDWRNRCAHCKELVLHATHAHTCRTCTEPWKVFSCSVRTENGMSRGWFYYL